MAEPANTYFQQRILEALNGIAALLASNQKLITVNTDMKIAPKDNGAIFTNDGATGLTKYELPKAQKGMQLTFLVGSAPLSLTPDKEDKINLSQDTSKPKSPTVIANEPGSLLKLIASDNNTWIPLSTVGVWGG